MWLSILYFGSQLLSESHPISTKWDEILSCLNFLAHTQLPLCFEESKPERTTSLQAISTWKFLNASFVPDAPRDM